MTKRILAGSLFLVLVASLFSSAVATVPPAFAATSWSSGVAISNPVASEDAYSQKVAVNAAGKIVVVWRAKVSGTYTIQASTSDDQGASWSSPVPVALSAARAIDPDIAVDSSGNFGVVWEEDSTTDVIKFSSSSDGVTWTPGPDVSDTIDAQSPQIVVDGSDYFTVVYQQANTPTTVKAATGNAAGVPASWSQTTLSNTANAASAPKIAADRNAVGQMMAVWLESDGANTRIRQRSNANGTWVSQSAPFAYIDTGVTSWSSVAATELANQWQSVAYGNGVWVAVSYNGTNRVMRSTDGGASWSAVAAAEANVWASVAYGNGVWVAVSADGTNRVMRSIDDGVSWSAVAAAEANSWNSVAYGNGVWVAVSTYGTNRVMRSIDDGVSWSAVAAAEVNNWYSVAYGNGVWVAVSTTGTNRVMRSIDDGVSWSAVAPAEANAWTSVAYWNGVWVAVSTNGTNRVMRSIDDGVSWSAVAAAEANTWQSVAYGNGVWVAVARDTQWTPGTTGVMRSTDGGVSWSAVAAAEVSIWQSVAYGNGVWVAVSVNGTNKVMRSLDAGVGAQPYLNVTSFGDGDFAVIWQNTNTTLTSSTTDLGSNWNPIVILDAGGQMVQYTAIEADGTNLVAAWGRSDGSDTRIEVSRSTNAGVNWSTANIISEAGENANLRGIATDGSSKVAITWARLDGSVDRSQVATSENGGVSWGAPVTFSQAGVDVQNPSVSYVGSGVFLHMWNADDGTGADRLQASRTVPASSGGSGGSGGGGSASAVVEDETVVVQRPAPVRTFEPVQQPVATSSSSPSIGQGPTLLVGGKPSALQVAVPNSNRLEVREGDLSISLSLPVGAGNVKNEKGVTEAEIMAGSALGLGGSGLRPGTFAQVFLSLAGQDSVELGRYEIGEDGTFSIDVRLDTMPFTSMPVPIGPQVLQMVSYDEDGNQIVLDLLVNVTQPPLAPEFNRLIGEIPGLLPGSSLATRAGIPIPLTVTGLADQNLVVFDGDGWSMGLDLLNEDAMVEPTEGGAFVRLTRDEPFLITGEGFKFPSTVGVYIFSEPTLVGTVEVDADGSFAADFFIDAALVPTGEHTLQMQGVGEDGYVRAANLGISVGDSAVPVAAAGPFAPWWTLIFIGLGLVLFGSLRRWGPIRENFAHNLATVMVFLMATPAVILGWISTVTAVTWWGLALGLVAMVLYYFVRPKSGASLVR